MFGSKHIRIGIALLAGMLATATAASAAIVYSGPISGATTENGYPNAHVGWDMESSNFAVGWYSYANPFLIRNLDGNGQGDIIPDGNYRCLVSTTAPYNYIAARLDSGTTIGTGSAWGGWGYLDEWSNGDRGYIGLTYYTSAGTKHYGWADVGKSADNYTVYGWAYDDTPDTAIAAGSTSATVAPEPGALAGLLCGIVSSAAVMRRRTR